MAVIRHLCIISPSFNIGGIERTVSEFANYFAGLGYQVTFISLLKGKRYFELHENVRVVEPNFSRSSSVILNGFYRLRLIPFIRKSVTNSSPDVVMSMSDTFNYLVIGALLGLQAKVFVGDVTKPDRKLVWMTRVGKKIFYPRASGFIAQTQSAARYYERFFDGRLNMTVINGAVKKIQRYNIERKPLILCAGRLSYEKGQDRLIEAFAKVEDRGKWQVVFTADGPFKPQLEKMVNENGLRESITFIGKVEDIDRLYAEASIFVLPSRMEGFPNALTEAMAAGLPCVCYDSFPAREIVEDNVDGLILPDGDINALTRTLARMMGDENLRKSLGAKAEGIAERLSIENIGNQLLSFLSQQNNR